LKKAALFLGLLFICLAYLQAGSEDFMFEQINEPIQVATLFRDGELKPLKFLWKGREFLVKTINLAYSAFEGRSKIYYFAVSDQNNYFKLQFNSDSLVWTLLESYVE
jgi:hypothetical protein